MGPESSELTVRPQSGALRTCQDNRPRIRRKEALHTKASRKTVGPRGESRGEPFNVRVVWTWICKDVQVTEIDSTLCALRPSQFEI